MKGCWVKKLETSKHWSERMEGRAKLSVSMLTCCRYTSAIYNGKCIYANVCTCAFQVYQVLHGLELIKGILREANSIAKVLFDFIWLYLPNVLDRSRSHWLQPGEWRATWRKIPGFSCDVLSIADLLCPSNVWFLHWHDRKSPELGPQVA